MRQEKVPDEIFDALIEKEWANMNRHERRIFKYRREAMRSAMASGSSTSYILTKSAGPQYKSPNRKPGTNGGTK